MQLTKEQLESAQKGEVVRVQTDAGEIVVVKADVYDKLAGLVYDELDPREMYPAVVKAWEAQGSSEDESAYQDFQ